jgi:hypothetical protein
MKVQRVAIPFQKENMIRINGANSLVNALVERPDFLFAYIPRLVDRIIARYPGMALIMVG